MAEQTVYQRQAPFIEERAEKLLASIFGTGQGITPGYGSYLDKIASGEDFMRTMDFQDKDGDGVDDRDQAGPGQPYGEMPQLGLAETPTEVPAYEVAGLSPQQQAAIQRAESGLGAYQPFLQGAQEQMGAAGQTIGTGLGAFQAATRTLDPMQVGTYMDPYQQQVTQEALAELDRQAEMQSQRTAAEAVAAGAFGGSRFGVREAEEARNLAQVKSQRIFEDLSRNYLQAQAAQRATAQQLGTLGAQTLQGAQTQLQAAQGQAGLGQLGQQLGGEDINRLLGLGQLTQQFGFTGQGGQFVPGQAQIEAARATSLAQQREPFERAAFASDILRGVPSSQITYTQQPSPSMLQQVLGLGIAGLGAYGSAGGTLGGISSLFGG